MLSLVLHQLHSGVVDSMQVYKAKGREFEAHQKRNRFNENCLFLGNFLN